jgi:site-specific DNA-cytosine methylase
MNAIGILAGVGSLLREAQDAGCKVMGNIETRGHYRMSRSLSWDLNFPDVPLVTREGDYLPASMFGADLALGHPPCGSHSMLGNSSAYLDGRFADAAAREDWHDKRRKDMGLLPTFCDLTRMLEPRAFALDNLPKILKTSAPPEWWQEQLPGYRLTFITMANGDYGTSQIRKRLWVVGVKRPLRRFVFEPKDIGHEGPVFALERIEDLPWEPWINQPEIGHVHIPPNENLTGDYRTTVPGLNVECSAQLGLGFLSIPPKKMWPYRTQTGRLGVKIGRHRFAVDGSCWTITGMPSIHHPITGWPLTPRERARLMDWPDDFHLGNAETDYTRSTLMRLTLFTGKAVPSAFPRFLIPQILNHIGG